jgi:hypothetical protein
MRQLVFFFDFAAEPAFTLQRVAKPSRFRCSLLVCSIMGDQLVRSQWRVGPTTAVCFRKEQRRAFLYELSLCCINQHDKPISTSAGKDRA